MYASACNLLSGSYKILAICCPLHCESHWLDNLQGSVSVDFESEVEDDIIPLFRRGEVIQDGIKLELKLLFFGLVL